MSHKCKDCKYSVNKVVEFGGDLFQITLTYCKITKTESEAAVIKCGGYKRKGGLDEKD